MAPSRYAKSKEQGRARLSKRTNETLEITVDRATAEDRVVKVAAN
jgi:hypothetical protein